MGCASSRVANEDTVRRCKERRRLMKEAVRSRDHLAAAHSDYLHSLRHVGSALSHFSSFLSLSVSDRSSRPVLLRPAPPPPSTAASSPPPPTRFSDSFRARGATAVTKKKPAGMGSSTCASTPSYSSSSAWNWEEHYPPSPPRSEFFDRLVARRKQRHQQEAEYRSSHRHHLLEEVDDDVEEEVHCNRSSTGSSTESDVAEYVDDYDDETTTKSDLYGSSAASVDHHLYRSKATPSSEPGLDGGGPGEDKMIVCHKGMKEIAEAIEENFVKVATAGEGVSDLLESGRTQLDRSFRQLKKTLLHSSSLLSNLTSTWTLKPPLVVRYHLDTAAMSDAGGKKSHRSSLEQLLAWENKLYQEVKAREGVKIEHEKKLSALQSQEYKGQNDAKLEKTRASINRLQSLILVSSQAVSTTSSAIIKVRNDELAPQLLELCCGFQQMWRSMNRFHEVQNSIVQQVRGLVNNSPSWEPTSENYRQATRDLESAVLDWHSSFTRVVKFHRSYIHALYAWLKLTFFQVGIDKSEEDSCPSLVSSELGTLCDEWKQAVDRLPDTVAAGAIKSFAHVIHSISTKQEEELKIRKSVETCSRVLEKRTSSLRSIEKRFYHSYSMVGVGIGDAEGRNNREQVAFDAGDPLAEKKSEVAAFRRRVEEEIARHKKAIKITGEMTLNNMQTGLPGVFQAITGFSGLSAAAFDGVCQQIRAL